MSIWVCLFVVYTLACAWLIFFGGTDTEFGYVVALFLGADPRSSERGSKAIIGFVWFMVALFAIRAWYKY